MQEWFINDEIEYLHRVITGAMHGSVSCNPVSYRLFQLSVLSLFNQINRDLIELSDELDVSVKLEGVSIDFDKYINEDYWTDNFLFKNEISLYKTFDWNIEDFTFTAEINEMTDYLPNGKDGFRMTPELIETFKNSLHQLCERSRIGSREILYSLIFGLKQMIELLKHVKEQVAHPKPHHFIKVWEEIYEDCEHITCSKSYLDWKEDNQGYNFKSLKKQQTIEIYKLVSSGFFRYYDNITGSDVKNRKLVITEDDLPVGSLLSENFNTDCARFENFYEWKDKDILSLNYEKLGQYIYRHYNHLSLEELRSIVAFDKTIDVIHEDMAAFNPKLMKHLKNYENNLIDTILAPCAEILNSCQNYLREDIRNTFLREYLSYLLYESKIKYDVREKLLSTKYRNKYLCEMIAVLDCFHVFNADTTKADFAKALSEKITKPSTNSIVDYFKVFQHDRKGPLYNWTKANIDELKDKPYNPFKGIK